MDEDHASLRENGRQKNGAEKILLGICAWGRGPRCAVGTTLHIVDDSLSKRIYRLTVLRQLCKLRPTESRECLRAANWPIGQ
jgi:hypothetical protein